MDKFSYTESKSGLDMRVRTLFRDNPRIADLSLTNSDMVILNQRIKMLKNISKSQKSGFQ